MKPGRTLHVRIPALVFLVGLLLIALAYVRDARWRVDRSIARLRLDAHGEGTRLSGMAQHFFRKRLQTTADLEVSYASVAPELDLGLVCDAGDVVRHATQLQWRGVHLSETPLREAESLLSEVRRTMSGRVVQDGMRQILAVFPFHDGTEDSAGAVVLRYDLTGPVAAAKKFALEETTPQAIALLAGCVLIWGVMHVVVVRRVDLLQSYAQAVSGGEWRELPDLGDDEIGSVGRAMGDAVNQMIRTEARLLEAGEQERMRIGRDLHDDVCQRITAAQLKAGMMGAALAEEGSPLAEAAFDIEKMMSETATIARGFARGLASVTLDVQPLATALEELAQHLERSFAVRCEVVCDDGPETSDVEVKGHLFRIAQELATNAAKHARGTFVHIRLRKEPALIHLEVENDGERFSKPSGGGLGLQFVRQRVRALGGQLRISPRIEGRPGTLVVCEVPISQRTSHPDRPKSS